MTASSPSSCSTSFPYMTRVSRKRMTLLLASRCWSWMAGSAAWVMRSTMSLAAKRTLGMLWSEVLDEVGVLHVGLGRGGEERERGVAEDGEDVEDDGAAAGSEARRQRRLLVAAVLADEHAAAVDVASDA